MPKLSFNPDRGAWEEPRNPLEALESESKRIEADLKNPNELSQEELQKLWHRKRELDKKLGKETSPKDRLDDPNWRPGTYL